jgi:hypothetical protein
VNVPLGPFLEKHDKFPVPGMIVDNDKFFHARVKALENGAVNLELIPKKGPIAIDYGEIRIEERTDPMRIHLRPRVGSPFCDGACGRITASDADNFTVDFNHPLAGKPLIAKLKVRSVTKADTLAESYFDLDMPLLEGRKRALADKKPLLIYFHSENCGQCKIFKEQALADKRMRMFVDDVVFAQVEINKQPEIAELYTALDTPSMILLDAQGNQAGRYNGGETTTKELWQDIYKDIQGL